MTDKLTRYNSPVDFRIAQVPPPGVPKEVYSVLSPIYAFAGQVIQALCQYCGIGARVADDWPLLSGSTTTLLSGNLRRFYGLATEAISAGAIITLYNNAGTIAIRNANATNNTKIADGFCSTVGGIAAGAVGEVILTTGVLETAGLTVGDRYWLALVNGTITNVAPVAAGNVEQYIGRAIDATHLYVEIAYPVQH